MKRRFTYYRMKTDALARRLRWTKPNPKVSRLQITPADLELFAVLDRHGFLPTRYLYEATKHIRRNMMHLKHRLTELYNGDAGGPYLTRPSGQFNAFEARYQDAVYGLSDRARAALGERLGRYPLKTSNEFVHDLMGACVATSIELGVKVHALAYCTRGDVLGHEFCPARYKDSPLAIPIDQKHRLVPDDLFAIEYPEGKRFFAVEIDRANESLTGSAANTFEKKILNYIGLMRGGAKEWWGIGKLHVLTVSTSAGHTRGLLKLATKLTQDTPFSDRFWFATEPCFGTRSTYANDDYWRLPKTLLTQLTEEPYLTPAGDRLITK